MAEFLKIPPKLERGQPSGSALKGECLSDEEVLAFAMGRLEAARLSEAHLHLDRCEVCQHLLSEAARALGTAPTTPLAESEPAPWNTMFQPGTLVGRRYRIVHFIARGGMGEVYEAFDDELQQRVALKTVTSTACDNPSAVRRLKGEVQLARRVSHPNVCRIYDFGTHAMAQAGAQISFLTMEYVDGETLGQRVRLAGALPMAEARTLARQMLLGLSAAHDAGVLHRDFKSDNVILRAEAGDQTSPLILDFGLARALDHESDGSRSNPSLVGTFGYIAPEQLQGKPHTTASDIYSFGIVWYEMLTGELPFEAGSSPAVAALERLQRAAPPPSSKNPAVPSELDAIVLRCLRRSPKDRFNTAGEVLAALGSLEDQSRSIVRKRWLVQLALAAGLGGISAYWAIPSRPRVVGISAVHADLSTPQQRPPQPVSAPEPDEPLSGQAPPGVLAPSPPLQPSGPRPPRIAHSAREPHTQRAQIPDAGTSSAPPSSSSAESAPPSAPAHSAPRTKPDWENPFHASSPH